VKPKSPRTNDKGKVIKYESPRGKGALQLFVPYVSVKSVTAIGTKFDRNFGHRSLSPDSNHPDFWELFLGCKDIPIMISEGAKDATGAISTGYPTISLSGIWGFGTSDKDIFGETERDESGNILKTLHPKLEQFVRGREVIFAFDRDSNPDTVKTVEAAKKSFRRCLEGVASKVTDIKWNNKDGKGVGDFIAAKGVEALDKAFAKRIEVKLSTPPKEKPASFGFSSSIETGLVALALGEDGKELLDKDGKLKSERIGNHLIAIATLNNTDKNESAFLLEFQTFDGSIRKWTMPRGYISGDGNLLITELYGREYSFIRDKKSMLLDYLSTLGASIEQKYVITDSSGWVDKSFVLPHKTHGDKNLRFRDVDPSPDVMTETKGSVEEWNQHIGSKCQSNSRMTFVVGMAFAAPLLSLVEMESGGLHLIGNTSEGKSTLLKVANSVTGGKEVQSWRSTANGLEAIATAHNHILLPIDELGQAEKSVGEAIYMLGNGQGKTRMTKQLANRKPKTWQLLFLSSGEIGLSEYMAQAGITQKGGQEVRMPSIPSVPSGSPFGVFEAIHGCDDSKQFATNIESACRKCHGAVMDAFLTRLVIDRSDEKFGETLRSRVFEVSKKLSEGTKAHAVSRVASRFALTQVALELAHSYGLLSFSVENIEWSVKKMFADWLNERGGDGSIEIKDACKRIQHLITSNLHSDRLYDLKDRNVNQKVRNLLGYAKSDGEDTIVEIWVPISVFNSEVCQGINKQQLIAELQKRKWLPQNANDGRSTHQRKFKGKVSRYFIFLIPNLENSSFSMDTLDTLDTKAETDSGKSFEEHDPVSKEEKGLDTLDTFLRGNAGYSDFAPNPDDGDTDSDILSEI
jgi:putative DNA primase/helicase